MPSPRSMFSDSDPPSKTTDITLPMIPSSPTPRSSRRSSTTDPVFSADELPLEIGSARSTLWSIRPADARLEDRSPNWLYLKELSQAFCLFFLFYSHRAEYVHLCEIFRLGRPATGDETGETPTCKQMDSDLLDPKLTGLRAPQFVGDSCRVRVPGPILKLEEAAEGAHAGWMDSSDCKLISKPRFNWQDGSICGIKAMATYPHHRTMSWTSSLDTFFFSPGIWYSAQVDSSGLASGKGVL